MGGIQTIEQRFPNAWQYLLKHEADLRKREDGRFAKGPREAGLWYGATRPQNLEYYFHPKLVLKVLSRIPSFTLDLDHRCVFAAGGTAGVHGIALKKQSRKHLLSMLAVLNSRCSDFCVKQISSVFGGRFYSYGDQFIADLAVPTDATDFPILSGASEALLELAAEKSSLLRKLRDFPESVIGQLARFEMDTVRHLCSGHPGSDRIAIDAAHVGVHHAFTASS